MNDKSVEGCREIQSSLWDVVQNMKKRHVSFSWCYELHGNLQLYFQTLGFLIIKVRKIWLITPPCTTSDLIEDILCGVEKNN